jgi:hypothetical protein
MERRTKNRSELANVPDPQGRIDVMLYQLAARVMQRLEVEQGLVGLREHVLPIVEDAILAHVPQQNLIPREIAGLIRVCELNRKRTLG